MMNIKVAIGHNIRTYRKSQGYTQEELAKLLRWKASYLGGIERGQRNVTVVNLKKISDALHIPVQVLVTEGSGDWSKRPSLRRSPSST